MDFDSAIEKNLIKMVFGALRHYKKHQIKNVFPNVDWNPNFQVVVFMNDTYNLFNPRTKRLVFSAPLKQSYYVRVEFNNTIMVIMNVYGRYVGCKQFFKYSQHGNLLNENAL